MTDGGKKPAEKTWLEQRREDLAQERADDERLADAVERAAEADLIKTLTGHGLGAVDRSAEVAERRRVQALIERDRADRAREAMRKAAEIEVGDGKFANLSDTVVEPTPEWMEKGAVERFTPRAPDGTVRSVTTVRRVNTPIVVRLHRKGKITDDQARACLWYRKMHEYAGLDGSYSSSMLTGMPLHRKVVVEGSASGHIPKTMIEAAARHDFRNARDSIPAFYLKFFDAVVLDDIPFSRAGRFARCPRQKIEHRFRQVAQNLADFCGNADVDLNAIDRD